MKPTGFRTKPTNFKDKFASNPLEFKFIGALGITVDEESRGESIETGEKRPAQNLSKALLSAIEVEVNVGTVESPEWRALDDVNRQCVATETVNFNNQLQRYRLNESQQQALAREMIQAGVALGAQVSVIVTHRDFKSHVINGIRIKRSSAVDSGSWRAHRLAIQAHVAVEPEGLPASRTRGSPA